MKQRNLSKDMVIHGDLSKVQIKALLYDLQNPHMKLTRLFIRESTDVIHVIHPLFVLTTGVYPLLVLTLREVVAIKVLMRDNGV
jgi:hypothetical protein